MKARQIILISLICTSLFSGCKASFAGGSKIAKVLESFLSTDGLQYFIKPFKLKSEEKNSY